MEIQEGGHFRRFRNGCVFFCGKFSVEGTCCIDSVFFFFFLSLTVDEESKKSNVMLLNEGGGVCLMWFQLGLKEFSIVLGVFLVA